MSILNAHRSHFFINLLKRFKCLNVMLLLRKMCPFWGVEKYFFAGYLF